MRGLLFPAWLAWVIFALVTWDAPPWAWGLFILNLREWWS